MNGEYMLIFATEEGGYYKSVIDAEGQVFRYTREEFEALKESGRLNTTPYGDHQTWVFPSFMALARIEDNYDFVLKSSREDAAVTA